MMKELLDQIELRRNDLRRQLELLKRSQDYENDLYQKINDNRRNVSKMQEQTFIIQSVIVGLIEQCKKQIETLKTV